MGKLSGILERIRAKQAQTLAAESQAGDLTEKYRERAAEKHIEVREPRQEVATMGKLSGILERIRAKQAQTLAAEAQAGDATEKCKEGTAEKQTEVREPRQEVATIGKLSGVLERIRAKQAHQLPE